MRIRLEPHRRPQVAAAATDENDSVETRWHHLQDTVQSMALAVLGRARHQHQNWFDGNDAAISSLFAENRLHKANVAALCNGGSVRCKTPERLDTVPILSSNGSTQLTKERRIIQRWAEHFKGVLNRPSTTTSDAAIARLTQVETNVDLDLAPSLHETITVGQQLSSGKAPGSDAISAEIYKHDDPNPWIT
ncbi:hypothetical protein SprV_0100183400 [Sparganum proliferum]